MRITADNLTKPARNASQVHAGAPDRFATSREADLPSTSCRGAFGETARHLLESITPAGLVLLVLLAVSAGLALALVLKVLSMALSV